MKITFMIIMILLALGTGGLLLVPKYKSSSSKDDTFTLKLPYNKVRQILSRGNALGRIVELQCGQVLDEHIDKLELSGDKLISLDWDVDIATKFTVLMQTEQIGDLKLSLSLKAILTKTCMKSEVALLCPCGYIKDVKLIMSMYPLGDLTQVKSQVIVVYERRVPVFLKEYMDRKVAEATSDILKKGQIAMESFMAEQSDKKFVLPINIR